MRNVLIIAGKEIREGMRNRWVLATTLLLAALALTLSLLGSAPTGNVGASALDVVIVSLSSLSVFLVPLIALLISHDAIVGESERGTLLLLLAYPVSRWQVIAGKFAGHVAILAFAITLGYGLAGLLSGAIGEAGTVESWRAFAVLIGSSIMLGAAFVAIGYLASALVSERSTAGGVAIGIWLLFVLIYDMAVLGLLVADQGRSISAGYLDVLLLLNPTDIYRLLNLGGAASVVSGMGGLADTVTLGSAALLAGLTAWIAAPLGTALYVFSRREL